MQRAVQRGARGGTVLLAFLASSCGGSRASTEPPPAESAASTVPDLPCDVGTVLQRRCGLCHGLQPRYGAPMPLTTASDVRRRADVIRARIHDDAKPMPPPPNARPDAAELAMLDAYLAAGAPASARTCDAAYGVKPSDAAPLPCTADTLLRPAAPYAVPQSATDQYVCFGVDVPLTKKRHVIALGANVDNAAVVHHVLLFQTPEAVDPKARPCPAFGSVTWRLSAGWAPGGTNLVLPREAGFPEEVGTTHWAVQIHYNNAAHKAGQVDSTGFDLCTTEELRPHDADMIAFGSMAFNIPARSRFGVSCESGVPSDVPLHLFHAWPHMHEYGKEISSAHLVAGAEPARTFVSVGAWSFESQIGFGLDDVVLNPGDTVRTRCTWDNPTGDRVRFGENTGNEMCFDFVAYWPKQKLSTWALPSVSARCTNL